MDLLWIVGIVTIAVVILKNLADGLMNKGPVLYPYVGNLLEAMKNRDRYLDWMTDYLKNAKGNTIKTMRPGEKQFICTASPSNIEYILKTNFENYMKGDHVQDILTDLLGDGIFNADGPTWQMQRKIASFEFTTRSLRDYLLDALREEKKRLLPTVEKFAVTGSPVLNLQDLFMRFMFDNICKIAFGIDPASLDPSFPKVEFMKYFDDATSLSNLRFYAVHPSIWKLKRALNLGSEKELKEAIAKINEFADSVIRNRRREVKNSDLPAASSSDLLSRFMHALQDEHNKDSRAPDRFLRDIIISFVLAGRDTTSVTLSWFFWLLTENPEAEENILSEIKAIIQARARSSETDDDAGDFSYEELKEMHYLHAAISETLRLYPAVPMDTKVAQKDDVWPDGTRIKKGMRATYVAYATGRLEEIWGNDCLEFKPERWLSDGQFAPRSAYKFPTFHAGPRICLGKDMAMIQMKYVCAVLLPRFVFRSIHEGYKPKVKLNLTLHMDGFPVTVHNRNA